MLYFSRMQIYELTIIIDGKATPAKQKSVVESIEKLVKTNKGNILKKDNWGKKDLKYEIKKSESGVYLYFELELDSQGAKNISSNLNTDEDILRSLLIKKE
jgi:small subunit ribosomal protein S6